MRSISLKSLVMILCLAFVDLSMAQAKQQDGETPPHNRPQKKKKKNPQHDFEYRFADDLKQTEDSLKRVDQWFRDAKFGAFIHFGVYSMLEGQYKGRGEQHRYSEWIMFSAKISTKEYKEIAATFNPAEFDAAEWAKTFKDAGIQYVVITSKHHDGFALFDSAVSDFNIADHTPFKRDLIKELCDACHAQGLKFGVYYSHAQDWSEPDAPYLNNRAKLHNFHPNLPEGFEQDFDRYITNKSLPQVEELVKNYPLDLIWFDTPVGIDEKRATLFSEMVRKHRPECLINSRIIHRGKGVIKPEYMHLYDYVSIGDKEVPTKKLPVYVESPDSVSSSFGFKTKGNHYYHSVEEMIQRMVHTVCAGGNALVNNGPMGNGKLDPEAVKLYQAMGQWLQDNGESIYSSRRNPLSSKPEGTDLSISKDGTSLYLHVMKWQAGKLDLSDVPVNVSSASFLETSAAVPFSQDGNTVSLTLPEKAVNPYVTVIKLSLAEPLKEN